ncbi:MAG: type II secretion system F family protein [Patescibacteria group bacterium]
MGTSLFSAFKYLLKRRGKAKRAPASAEKIAEKALAPASAPAGVRKETPKVATLPAASEAVSEEKPSEASAPPLAEEKTKEERKKEKKEEKEEAKREQKEKKKGGLSKPLNLKFLKPRITQQERINFARHLSIAIKSGLPLLEALRLIEGQASSKKLSRIVGDVIVSVNSGQSLAQALGRYQRTFGEFFVSMVRVGEASGSLASNLLYLSQELRKQHEIQGRAKSAMIYPLIVLIATIGMTVALTVFIFPKILPIFSSLRVELPFTTRIVIQMMTFFQTSGFLALGGVIGFFILTRGLLAVKALHFWFDRFVLSFPVVSKIVTALTLANFTRSLSILLKSGMTLIDALGVTKVTFHNRYYQWHVEQLIDVVRRGEEIAHYMAEHPHLFPPMLSGMIKVGENTGTLEENLLYLSEYFTEEVESSVRNLTSLLEPILVLFMGLVVGFIALSIIMPIYSITQGLRVK